MQSEFLQIITSRRSIRVYTDRRPDRATIERLIAVAVSAPSNHNRQGWKFVVFEDRDEIEDLARRARESVQRLLADSPRAVSEQGERLIHYAGAFDVAPILILAMHKNSPAIGRSILTHVVDAVASGEVLSTAMAIENLLLAAHATGLGACVMTAPLLAGDVWSQVENLPPGFVPTCLITLGYPAETPDPPPKKSLLHVIEYRGDGSSQ